MTTFENGPAAGQILQLQAAPLYLRVVEKGDVWDALDLPGDGPQPEETIYCYKRKGEAVPCFVDGSSPKGGRWGMRLAIATYTMCTSAPGDDIMRDNDRWRDWCEDQKIDLGKPVGSSDSQLGQSPEGEAGRKLAAAPKQNWGVGAVTEIMQSIPASHSGTPQTQQLMKQQDLSVPFRGEDHSEHKATTKWYDIVGGNLDGKQHPVDHPLEMPTHFMLDGETYMALQFKRDENKPAEVIIFMIADDTMNPSTAMKIWRDRNLTDGTDKTIETAKRLATATVAKIAQVGVDKYLELAEAMLKRIAEGKVFVGRGGILIELAQKIADVRAFPDKYKPTTKPEAGSVAREKSPATSAPPPSKPAKPKPKPMTPEQSAKSMGAIPLPVDPDDEPW